MSAIPDVMVELKINEPLDVYRVLRGKIVRPVKSLKEKSVYYLFQTQDGEWLVLKPRYESDQIHEVYRGKQVQVVVASIIDQDVSRSNCFRLNQVNYFGIGVITVSKD